MLKLPLDLRSTALGAALLVVAPASASAAVTSIEAESLRLPATAGKSYTDRAASGRAGLLMWNNNRVTVPADGPVQSIAVKVKADLCGGEAPKLRVSVGAKVLATRTVSSKTWRTITVSLKKPATGTVRLAYVNNDERPGRGCDRNLRIDWIALDDGTAPLPQTETSAPAPDPSSAPGTEPDVAVDDAAAPDPIAEIERRPRPEEPAPTPVAPDPAPQPVPAPPSPKPTVTPKPTTTPKPSVTPKPTATPTPRPTAAPTPTAAPAPTPTATPAPTAAPTPTPVPTPTSAPAGPTAVWTNPDNAAARAADAIRATRPSDARLLDKIGDVGSAMWLGDYSTEQSRLAANLAAAKAANKRLVLVVYGIPFRDGGQYSSGGLSNTETYKAWIDSLAARIAGNHTTIIVEPDAVAMSLDSTMQAPRYAQLTYAVQKLGSLANSKVYLDAGNSGWKTAAVMIPRLKSAGIAYADGFSINVSNFKSNTTETAYGNAISAGTGGKPFVIDTSRNGNGSLVGAVGEEAWCNPSGRALGNKPTTSTGTPNIAAYLWLKLPGSSDGACRGYPKAGEFIESLALEMARNAKW